MSKSIDQAYKERCDEVVSLREVSDAKSALIEKLRLEIKQLKGE